MRQELEFSRNQLYAILFALLIGIFTGLVAALSAPYLNLLYETNQKLHLIVYIISAIVLFALIFWIGHYLNIVESTKKDWY